MITYSGLGHPRNGRLGNQLFQIASTIGMATLNGIGFGFPAWEYSQYFSFFHDIDPKHINPPTMSVEEVAFHYNGPEMLEDKFNWDVRGWRQSEKYWEHCRPFVRAALAFREDFEAGLKERHADLLMRPVIALSVRRGDFVDNPNYAQVPALFYLLGLFEEIPAWHQFNIAVFSDNLEWCRVHFEGLPNVHFMEGSAIEQLCLMSMCQHFVISNSTFSWWGAWLGEKAGTIVIRPPRNFDGPLARQHDERDFWPERWRMVDHRTRKLQLRDLTITSPVFVDHRHRAENLLLSMQVLQENCDLGEIIVGTQGDFPVKLPEYVTLMEFAGMDKFHRTRMLNLMARGSATEYVANWDCDIILPLAQIYVAVLALRGGADMVYPFDGRFARVPRTWFPVLQKSHGDIGLLENAEMRGRQQNPGSVGGAIFFDRRAFLQGGGENEFMVSFGPEDHERRERFQRLGYDVRRMHGTLYHLDHWIGPNSSSRNPHFHHNHRELDRMRLLSDDELEQYVWTWPWR